VGLPGLVASVGIAVGAVGVGWLAPVSPLVENPVVSAVRESSVGSLVAKVILIAAATALLRVWLSARTVAQGLDVRGAQQLGALSLVWSAPLLFAPVLFSRDVFSYIALSRLPQAGVNPYEQGTGALPTYWRDGADAMWHDSPSPYGPLWTALSSLLHLITDAEPIAALVGFRLAAVAGVALLVVSVPRLAGLAGANPGLAAWLAVLNPLVLFHLCISAHNEALMVGLMVAGLAQALRGRMMWAVVLVTAAACVKAPAVLALPFLGLMWAEDSSWTSRLMAWAKTSALAVGTGALLTILAGMGTGWLANLTTPTKVDTWLSPATATGRILGLVSDSVGGPSGDAVLTATRAVALLAAAAVIGWLVLTAHHRAVLPSLALSMLVLVGSGPVVHPWYLLWALPLVAVLNLTVAQLRAAVMATIALTVYSVANPAATTSSTATLPDGVSVIATVAVLAVALMLRRPERAPSRRRGAPHSAQAVRDRGYASITPSALWDGGPT
jgi:hypothetical protein